MPSTTAKLNQAVEAYFAGLRLIRASGGATDERSLYLPLANLLNAVGATLQPKVFCVQELADQGVGHPDFGLYTTQQVQKGKPKSGQKPERGVIEVKPVEDDAGLTADSAQVAGYWEGYRQVLVTNTRDFILLGEDPSGNQVRLESFTLAESAAEFDTRLSHPRAYADDVGLGLGEYLTRVLSHAATLTEPQDVAWLLASYARDGLARVEKAGDAESLASLREALEESLGVHFEGERGAAFFRSTLVQTLFYGVFSAWVLWARQSPSASESFDWRTSGWHLRTPVLRGLFQQAADPGQLWPLGLVEVLDWTAAALNRVDREAFFAKFSESEAVTYFYEPFLQAFDPDLRKQLGVWYTPAEIVRYMVTRVDRALKDDLGIADGLAGEQVYVLDPCCGTGAYLAEVLRCISTNLGSKGLGALKGARVKEAATKRVFGFEIMPAPFVVAHLQVGLTMEELGVPLSQDGSERAGVFLTNALTGWEPVVQKPLPFHELEQERERAGRVKQNTPVLVILGNPPYNGFAGVAVKEEKTLSDAYRTPKQVRKPEGQGLNDLYVRFFRMAERRIAEKTKQGIVCFISNYSWLDGLSFTAMRERYLEEFDAIRIDNLHGDRIISEYAPDGRTSETVFALQGQSPGIKVGTSVAMLSKKSVAGAAEKRVLYRDFHQARATERREALLKSLTQDDIDAGYSPMDCNLSLGLPFKPMAVSGGWHDWPALPDLFPTSFPGVKTSRDGFLVDVDLDRLKERVAHYFDAKLSNEEVARRYPVVMKTTARFDADSVRDALLRRGGPLPSGFVRYTYRPFDDRWLYWEASTKLLDEKRADYKPHTFEGNRWLSAVPRLRRDSSEAQTAVSAHLASLHLNEWSASMFPAWLRDDGLTAGRNGTKRRPNLSSVAQHYLDQLGLDVEDLFYHAVATLHDPGYRSDNAGALRLEWPRIPLVGWPDGAVAGASEEVRKSADQGRELAALLDSDTPVVGVTTGPLREELSSLAVPTTADGGSMANEDFMVSAGWGYFGSGDVVMPGQGRIASRTYDSDEHAAVGDAVAVFGEGTFDVYLGERAYWRNVQAAVWNYHLGGYQVLKKWRVVPREQSVGAPAVTRRSAALHGYSAADRRHFDADVRFLRTDDDTAGKPALIPPSNTPRINVDGHPTSGDVLWFAVLWIIFTGTCWLVVVGLAIDIIPLGPWLVPVVATAGVLSLVVGTTAALLTFRCASRDRKDGTTEPKRMTRTQKTIGIVVLLLLIPGVYLTGFVGREFDEWRNGRKAEASQVHFTVAKFLDGGPDFHPDALNQTLAELEDGRRQLQGNWVIPEDAGPISVIIFRNLESYREWRNREDSLGSVRCASHAPVMAIPLEQAPSLTDGDYYTRTPAHEVVHAMMCQSLGREKFLEIPMWFHEGVAEHYSAKGVLRIKSRVMNRVEVLRARNQLIEPARFCAEDFYSSSASEMSLFYATSQELVKSLAATHGIQKFHVVVDSLRLGTPFDDAMETMLGGICLDIYPRWVSSFGGGQRW